MEKEEFLKVKSDLLKEQADFKKLIDKKYGLLVAKFLDSNIPYKREQVVLIGDGKKAKRMVIFKIEPLVLEHHVIIHIYGWYLDADNNPVKWEGGGIAVYGISNPKTISISENQVWNPLNQHPVL